jgi:HD-GYP domain-containing protein (c-di-GMP phosphodiesterase class II)
MNPEFLRIVQGFAGAFKGLRLYPLHHPAIERQIENLLAGLSVIFLRKPTAEMGLMEGSLVIEDYLFTQANPGADEICGLLQALQLEGLEFHRGLAAEELRSFFGILAEGKITGGENFEILFAEKGVHHIRTRAVRTGEDEEQEEPRKVYGRALKVVDRIFHDVRLGKIPSSDEAKSVVKSMVQLTLTDPHALFALTMLKDYDNYTFTHSVNVSVIALAVGRASGLSEEELRILGMGALLHDLGKLKIEREIITKPGRLTEQEFEKIKKHPRIGADLIEMMEDVTREIIDVVLGHHLRYDRSGYPADVRGREISPLTDMAAIADTYDAMTTLRSYQQSVTPRRAIEKLRALSGNALHPQYLDKFIHSLGSYPVGSLVRLDNGEIGLVVRVGLNDPDAAELKILFNDEGRELAEPRAMGVSGKEGPRIIAEIDPFAKGIDVGHYFGRAA